MMVRELSAIVVLSLLIGDSLAGYRHNPEYVKVRRQGGLARIVLRVVDDLSSPVPDVAVKVFMGMNYRPQGYWIDGRTTTNGVFVIEGVTCGNEIEIHLSREGYYNSDKTLTFARMGEEHDVKDGKWLPYPLDVDMVLRKIKKPTPLTTGGGRYEIPGTNRWCSFDLLKNDWVVPNGKGEVADVELRFQWTGTEPLKWQSQSFGIRFPKGRYNGAYWAPAMPESRFAFEYSADPTRLFILGFADENFPTARKISLLDGSKDMVFRIRSTTNSMGRLASCYYGRFRKLNYYLNRSGTGGVLMRYEYNPTRNATNLEPKEEGR